MLSYSTVWFWFHIEIFGAFWAKSYWIRHETGFAHLKLLIGCLSFNCCLGSLGIQISGRALNSPVQGPGLGLQVHEGKGVYFCPSLYFWFSYELWSSTDSPTLLVNGSIRGQHLIILITEVLQSNFITSSVTPL